MNIAMVCTALLGMSFFALSLHVSFQRRGTLMLTGLSDDPTSALNKAVRAHGNLAEFAPILCILMLIAEDLSGAYWVDALCVVVTVARLVTIAGFLWCDSLAKVHPFRKWGAVFTYLGGFALSVIVLTQAFI